MRRQSCAGGPHAPRAPYTDLESKCLANETMPSIVFNPRTKHSCALVFKRDAMVKHLKGWKPGLAAIGRGERIVSAIPGLGIGGWAWAWLADCNDPAAAKAAIKEHGAAVSEDDALRP